MTWMPNVSRIIRKYRSADPDRASFFSGCSKVMFNCTIVFAAFYKELHGTGRSGTYFRRKVREKRVAKPKRRALSARRSRIGACKSPTLSQNVPFLGVVVGRAAASEQ